MSRFNISEIEQRELFAKNAESKTSKLYYEVPVFCRSVDLVIHDHTDNTITAIEFKLTDWKRAAKQALSVAICFDYVEICIPQPKTEEGKKAVIDYCNTSGIGVYFLDIETKEITRSVFPKKIQKIWEIQRTQVIDYLGRQ